MLSAPLVAASVLSHPLYEAGLLHAIRNAVVVVLLIVFAIGGAAGFFIARLFYRR